MTLTDWQAKAAPHLLYLVNTCDNTDPVCDSCEEIMTLLRAMPGFRFNSERIRVNA